MSYQYIIALKHFVRKTGHNTLSFLSYLLFFVTALLFACNTNDKDLSQMTPYTGPSLEVKDIETLYTDSASIKVRLTAPKELQMENGDLHFPEGVYIEFYNEDQVKTSTLRGNSGIHYKENDLYTVKGNVVIIDSVKSQKMNTEELNWTPAKKQIYTDKFVTIQTKEEVIKGQGLEANQDFSHWRILKPTGTLPIPQ